MLANYAQNGWETSRQLDLLKLDQAGRIQMSITLFDSIESEVLGSRRSDSESHGRMPAGCMPAAVGRDSSFLIRVC